MLKQKSIIHGVFYKVDEYQHFILPEVYHNNTNTNTSSILNCFDKKVSDLFEKKEIPDNADIISLYSPMYRDHQYRDFKTATHFKCKSTPMKLIVGLEYEMLGGFYT
jgi:hypothetical protein